MDSSQVLAATPDEFAGGDDAELVAAARRDPAHFETLYRSYLPGIYRYMRVRCRHQDEALDLTHQVFLQALASLPRYQERGLPFGAWLFRIARNAVTDRRRRHHSTVPWDALPEAMHPRMPDEAAADVLRREEIEAISRLLLTIEPEKRELLALRFAAGLKVREIAAVLGRSEAAVKTDLHRTLRTLKERWDED